MNKGRKKEFMRLAIEEAKKSTQPLKCGAVIVKNDLIIAKAHNSQRKTNNAAAHAEINAIKQAGNKIGNKNLQDCEIYCTCEPCIMCLSAILFANIKKLYYGVSLSAVSSRSNNIDITIDEFIVKSPHKFQIQKNYLIEVCQEIYDND